MTRFILTTLVLFFVTLSFSQQSLIGGQHVTGDFNGDGKIDTGIVKKTINAKTKAKTWTLFFSDKNIIGLRLGCCDVYLINEGDLNNDNSTEISVFQAPENGCTYMWTTFSYKADRWTKLIPTFLVPNYCEPLNFIDLEKKVFIENGKIYYWDIDINDEKNKLIKRQVSIK